MLEWFWEKQSAYTAWWEETNAKIETLVGIRGRGFPALYLYLVQSTKSFSLPLSKIYKTCLSLSPYLITHQVQDKANGKLTTDLYLT